MPANVTTPPEAPRETLAYSDQEIAILVRQHGECDTAIQLQAHLTIANTRPLRTVRSLLFHLRHHPHLYPNLKPSLQEEISSGSDDTPFIPIRALHAVPNETPPALHPEYVPLTSFNKEEKKALLYALGAHKEHPLIPHRTVDSEIEVRREEALLYAGLNGGGHRKMGNHWRDATPDERSVGNAAFMRSVIVLIQAENAKKLRRAAARASAPPTPPVEPTSTPVVPSAPPVVASAPPARTSEPSEEVITLTAEKLDWLLVLAKSPYMTLTNLMEIARNNA